MYKIVYNDKEIRLCHNTLESHLPKSSKETLVVHYPGKSKFILNYLDKLEKSKEVKNLFILHNDLALLKQDFFSLFKIVHAAGGLVINSKGEVLMIHRRGCWDLPKGKMENFESKKEAAVREVLEETGLQSVKLIKKLTTTHHIYRAPGSGKRVLKPSYWYLMHTKSNKVTPQKEEDIEIVEWKKITKNSLLEMKPIYNNILDVLKKYIRWVG